MSILDSAEVLLQAKNYSGSGNWLDETANDHDAVNNGALHLSHTGTQYVHLPGIAANYVSTPDAAALDLLGDIWIAGRFALTDWTPASDQTLIAKWEDTSNERAYRLMVDTTGVLRLGWSTDGTSANAVEEDSTVAPTVSNGAILWVAGTVDVSVGTVKFYTGGSAATPVWVQLGTTVVGSGATSIGATTAVLEVGSDNTGTAQLLIGEVYNAQVEDGYDEGVGTLQFDADFSNATKPYVTFAEASTNTATVTFNRSTGGRKLIVVDRSVWLLGTDDWLEIPDDAGLDFGASEDMTAMFVGRLYNESPAADFGLVAKYDRSGQDSWWIDYDTSETNFRFTIRGGATSSTALISNPTLAGLAFSLAGVRNTTDDDVTVFHDGAAGTTADDNTTGGLANSSNLHIGNFSDENLDSDIEVFAVALWRAALSDAEIPAAHVALTVGAGGGGMLLLDVG